MAEGRSDPVHRLLISTSSLDFMAPSTSAHGYVLHIDLFSYLVSKAYCNQAIGAGTHLDSCVALMLDFE